MRISLVSFSFLLACSAQPKIDVQYKTTLQLNVKTESVIKVDSHHGQVLLEKIDYISHSSAKHGVTINTPEELLFIPPEGEVIRWDLSGECGVSRERTPVCYLGKRLFVDGKPDRVLEFAPFGVGVIGSDIAFYNETNVVSVSVSEIFDEPALSR